MKRLLIVLPILFLWFPSVSHAALTDNISAYWKLDGNSNDSVGSLNGSDTSITYSTGNGKINQGAGFNGTSSVVNIGGTGLPTGDRTECVWLYPTTFASAGTILDYGTRASYQDWAWEIFQTTGKQNVDIYNEGSAQSNTALTLNAWNFTCIAYVQSSKTITYYLNGSSDGTATFTNTPGTTLSGTARIGSLIYLTWFNGWNGNLDELGVWSRALTSTEISQLYNAGAGLQYPFTLAGNPFQLWVMSLF